MLPRNSGVLSLNSREGGCETQNLKLKTENFKLAYFEGGGGLTENRMFGVKQPCGFSPNVV